MASRWKYDINQDCISAFPIYPKLTLTYKNQHPHTRGLFLRKSKFSTVDSILTKSMMYFEDKTNRKKKTAALLLYTQLEHYKIILQEQHHLLHVFGLFIQTALCFLSIRPVPTAVFDKRVFYLHLLYTQEQFCVSFMRKID